MKKNSQLPLTKGLPIRNYKRSLLEMVLNSQQEEENVSESIRLELTRMETKLDTKMDVIISMLSSMSGVKNTKSAPDLTTSEISYLRGLTTRQHCVAQMLLQGSLNKDIANVMQVSENTAKLHVRAVCMKANVRSRSEASLIYKRIVDNIDPEEYLQLSRGLPIDWFVNLQDPDPYFHLYEPFRKAG